MLVRKRAIASNARVLFEQLGDDVLHIILWELRHDPRAVACAEKGCKALLRTARSSVNLQRHQAFCAVRDVQDLYRTVAWINESDILPCLVPFLRFNTTTDTFYTLHTMPGIKIGSLNIHPSNVDADDAQHCAQHWRLCGLAVRALWAMAEAVESQLRIGEECDELDEQHCDPTWKKKKIPSPRKLITKARTKGLPKRVPKALKKLADYLEASSTAKKSYAALIYTISKIMSRAVGA